MNKKTKKKSKNKDYNIKFNTNYENIQSLEFHPLSKNGPYFDAHFGELNNKTPVGETYYIRPTTQFTKPCKNKMKEGCGCGGKGDGSIKFIIKECFPSVHSNNNSVSTDFAIDGKVEIKPFDWGKNGIAKVFSNQKVKTDLKVINKTGKKMQGFHIHDGQLNNGLTSFGPISYFLYSSPEWQKLYNTSKESMEFTEKYAPIPHSNIVLKNGDSEIVSE